MLLKRWCSSNITQAFVNILPQHKWEMWPFRVHMLHHAASSQEILVTPRYCCNSLKCSIFVDIFLCFLVHVYLHMLNSQQIYFFCFFQSFVHSHFLTTVCTALYAYKAIKHSLLTLRWKAIANILLQILIWNYFCLLVNYKTLFLCRCFPWLTNKRQISHGCVALLKVHYCDL